MQPPKEGNDNRGKAITGRYGGLQLTDRSGNLKQTGKTGKTAAQQQGKPDHAFLPEPNMTRGLRGLAHHAQLEPDHGFRQQNPPGNHHQYRKGRSKMDPRPVINDRQQACIRERAGFREVESFGVAPRPMHKEAQEQCCDIGQHQAGQDFVGIESGAQKRRYRPPEGPANRPKNKHCGQKEHAFTVMKIQRKTTAEYGAHGQLTLGTDVPDIGAEPHRQPDGNDHKRTCLNKQFRKSVAVVDRQDEESIERIERVLAHKGKDDPADKQRH